MRKISFIVIISLTLGNAFAQTDQREKWVYAGSYNMSGLMTQIAQVVIQTEPVKTTKKTYLHASMTATTFSKWDNFFKIRDLYESYVDPATLKPSLYKRSILEGNYRKTEKYIFNNGNVTSTSSAQGRTPATRSFKVGTGTADIITTILKVRMVDWSKMNVGQTAPMTVVFDEKEFAASVKYMGKENIDGKPCYKLSIGAKTNALKGTDKNLLWLSADTKKTPVFIRFSIPVGTGQLKLTSASGM